MLSVDSSNLWYPPMMKLIWCLAALRSSPEGLDEKEAALVAALEAAPHSIQGGRYSIGSQFHFYMEPQVRSLNPSLVAV